MISRLVFPQMHIFNIFPSTWGSACVLGIIKKNCNKITTTYISSQSISYRLSWNLSQERKKNLFDTRL